MSVTAQTGAAAIREQLPDEQTGPPETLQSVPNRGQNRAKSEAQKRERRDSKSASKQGRSAMARPRLELGTPRFSASAMPLFAVSSRAHAGAVFAVPPSLVP